MNYIKISYIIQIIHIFLNGSSNVLDLHCKETLKEISNLR